MSHLHIMIFDSTVQCIRGAAAGDYRYADTCWIWKPLFLLVHELAHLLAHLTF